MKKTRVIFSVLIVFIAMACNNSGNQAPSFDQQVASAQQLLANTPTGTQSLDELHKMLSDGRVIGIKPLTMQARLGHAGAIRQVSDGVYEIQLMPNMAVEDLAQGIAHELVHVKNEVLEDKYLDDNKDLNDRMEYVDKHLDHDMSDLYDSHKEDVDLFFASVMFEEVKAYQRNLKIELEGIPFHNDDLKNKGLFEYIRTAYVPEPVSIPGAEDGDEFIKLVSKYDNVPAFQKAFSSKKHGADEHRSEH